MTRKMNQDDIRLMNYLLVLKILRTQRSTSMTQLSHQTKLTLPSISSIVSDLEMYGLVKNAGVVQARRGRFPKLYEFNEDAYHVIGLTIRSDMVSAGLVNLDGRVIQVLSERLEEDKHPEKITATSVSLIRRLMEKSQQRDTVLGIGVSMHGIVDPVYGISVYPAQFKWSNFPLVDSLKNYLDMPIMMENDINCLLLAEKWFGEAKDIDSFVMINVDYGIGAGIMSNGTILHGADFGSGQIGHVAVGNRGILCDCGKIGCLETVASEKAILRDIANAIQQGENSKILDGVNRNVSQITVEHVYDAAESGDSVAKDRLESVGHDLGIGISILVNLLNPQKIILTGGILRGMGVIYPALKQSIDKHSLSTNLSTLDITTSKLGPHSNVVGAAALWIEALLTGKIPFTSLVRSQLITPEQ